MVTSFVEDRRPTVRHSFRPHRLVLAGVLSALLVPFSLALPTLLGVQIASDVAAAVTLAALAISLARGGVRGFPFGITAVAAYPALTPFIKCNVLGYSYFSGWATEFQSPSLVVVPLLTSSIACLFIAVFVTDTKPSLSRVVVFPRSKSTAGTLASVAAIVASVLFFAWLTEPGGIVGEVSYADIIAGRLNGTDFAGAAWVCMSVLAVGLSVRAAPSLGPRARFVLRAIVVLGLFLSAAYLLLHARRSELTGLALLLFVLFTQRMSRLKLAVASALGLFAIAAVGYLRAPDPLAHLEPDAVELPGAPENVFVGYVVGNTLRDRGEISITPGETYLGYIEALPPSFLGLPRPPTAYDYVRDQVQLIGGQYFLLEPVLNFGIFGILPYLWLFVGATNWSIHSIERYFSGSCGLGPFVLGSSFIAMIFRTVWYGPAGIIKTVIIAGLVAGFILIIRLSPRYEAQRRPVRERPQPAR